eukprot:1690886-Pleurochrysis_carterae.AAC.2
MNGDASAWAVCRSRVEQSIARRKELFRLAGAAAVPACARASANSSSRTPLKKSVFAAPPPKKTAMRWNREGRFGPPLSRTYLGARLPNCGDRRSSFSVSTSKPADSSSEGGRHTRTRTHAHMHARTQTGIKIQSEDTIQTHNMHALRGASMQAETSRSCDGKKMSPKRRIR